METERIRLRPWRESDAEVLFKYASDPEVGPRAGWPPHKNVEESLEIIQKFFSNDYTWAVELKETGEVIGCVGYLPSSLSNLKIGESECEVGYWIARPFWNEGICTEALQLVIDHCFQKKGFTVLWGSFFPSNPASGRVMEKCGFTDTGEETICPNLEVGSDQPVRVMKLEALKIRLEQPQDWREVENLTREAFWNVYRPGCTEHYVLHCYRSNPDFIPELDFVMEENGRIIGHVMFSKAEIVLDDGTVFPSWTFGPISIHPDCKRKGYGLKLLQYALEKAREHGVGLLCMEGNIDFYKHAGFDLASKMRIHYRYEPRESEVPYFLAQELIPGYWGDREGTYGPPKGYFVADENPEAFEAYEATFPYKEKLVLPGQLC